MAWDNSFIDELKNRVNIVDVVGHEVQLKKSGSNYSGLCPFHSEKTPSFMVNEEKQIFNCFGCGEKGDVIKFVQSYYKISFMEAVEKLCKENGIKMPERTYNGPKIDYDKYYDINVKAARFFYNSLGKAGNPGYAYFRRRGLSNETITKFGLGYAPGDGYSLVKFLQSEQVADDDIIKLGLAKKGKSGLYDKFRNRVIFPIINAQGKVIGFGGRALDDSKPKYLNSDESEIFLKKNNLFGLNITRRDIADEDRVVMVEGYMDLISLWQGGVRNVAASLGTALTDNQARLISRYTKNVVLSYDSDSAGINAALRGIDVLSNAGCKVRVLRISDGKDPDDFIKAHGKDEFNRLVNESISGTEFKLDTAAAGYNFENDYEIVDYIDRIVPILRKLGHVELDICAKRLSEKFNVSEHAIMMAVQTEASTKTNYMPGSGVSRNRTKANIDRILGIELSFLVLSMYNTRYLKRIREDGIQLHSKLAQKIMSVEESLAESGNEGTHRIDENDIFRALEPDEETAFAGYVRKIYIGPDDEAFYQEIRAAYLVNGYKDERIEVLNELAVAEKLNRSDEMDKLAARLIELDSLIKSITGGKNVG